MSYLDTPIYQAYLAASRRCAEVFAGIRTEPDRSRSGSVRGYWLYVNGSAVYSDRKAGTFQTEAGARQRGRLLVGLAPAPVPAPASLQPGWSNASKARRGITADAGVGAIIGLRSHVPAGSFECHYCGLDRRSCDCH